MHKEAKRHKIILTGATGAIGLAIIQKCIEKNWEAIVIVRPESARNQRIEKPPRQKSQPAQEPPSSQKGAEQRA